jgi:hypothetical protein
MNRINLMKFILSALVILVVLTSCEEKDKTGDNPAPPSENVVVRLSLLYDEMGFHADSAITNNLGQSFYIDDVSLVFSNVFIREGMDTVSFRGEPFVLATGMTNKGIITLEPGGYSASYSLLLGLDSAGSADIAINGIPADSDLRDVPVLRPDGNGIDHIVINGRVVDPTNPMDSTGTITMSYRIGTADLSRSYSSLQKNFSIQGEGKVSLVVRVDLGPALMDFDVVSRPVIITDPQNLVDLNLATQIANNIKVELF